MICSWVGLLAVWASADHFGDDALKVALAENSGAEHSGPVGPSPALGLAQMGKSGVL